MSQRSDDDCGEYRGRTTGLGEVLAVTGRDNVDSDTLNDVRQWDLYAVVSTTHAPL